MCVEQRSIPCSLTAVDVYPSLAVRAVNFCPDVIFRVPDPSYSASNRSAKHGETIYPLSYSTSPGLKEDESVIVSWEALE